MYSAYVLFLVNIASDRPLDLTPSTVGGKRWFFLGLECFALFGAMLPISASMTYWACRDIEKNLIDSMDYQKLPPGRMESAQEFIRAPSFARDVSKAGISSIPRWRFIREEQADADKKGKFPDGYPCSDLGEEFEYVPVPGNLRGVAMGQKGFPDDARRIIEGAVA